MSSGKLMKFAAPVLLGAGVLFTAQTAAAQSVVVRATGPSSSEYPAGKRIATGGKVTLKSGDMITVLDKSGTRVLKGPGTFALDGKVSRDRKATTRMARLMDTKGKARARTGAVRGSATAATPEEIAARRPSNIWQIDTTRGGTWCVAEPSSLSLWRADRDAPVTASLSGQTGSNDVMWGEAVAETLWPEDMAVVDSATYTLKTPGSAPVTLITRVLPNVPMDDMSAVAGMLADAGCTEQLGLLAATAEEVTEVEVAAE